MLVFATEFPVRAGVGSADFLAVVRKWLLGSPHKRLSPDSIAAIGSTEPREVTGDAEGVTWVSCELDDGSAATGVVHTKSDEGHTWRTTLVLSARRQDAWVAVRTERESDVATTLVPRAKKPQIVRFLLAEMGGAKDGALPVTDTPYYLRPTDVELAAKCIMGTARCRLPVVYVSAPFLGAGSINGKALAERLGGMAHVVVEPNRPFSVRLMTEVDRLNVYGGTVGIYWPEGSGRTSLWIDQGFDSPERLATRAVQEVTTALLHRMPQPRCSMASIQSALARKALADLQADGSASLAEYMSSFDGELAAANARVEGLERDNARLRAEVERFRPRDGAGRGISLASLKEQDLYAREIEGYVYEALATARATTASDGSRRAHVLDDLLASRSDGPSPQEALRERVKAALRDYQRMDARTRRELEGMGFDITEEGKHYKLLFQADPRYTFTIPKTGSDYRGGMNAASTICNKLF